MCDNENAVQNVSTSSFGTGQIEELIVYSLADSQCICQLESAHFQHTNSDFYNKIGGFSNQTTYPKRGLWGISV